MSKKIINILLFSFLILCLFASSSEKEPELFKDPRDAHEYKIVRIGDLFWFKENLRYRTESNADTLIAIGNCGMFYPFEIAAKACPDGWRLPTEKEVNKLIKDEKKGRINLIDTLSIELCGRIDYDNHTKPGQQNTFWLDESLEEGHVPHWHTFDEGNKIHSHNVINARRKFPVRCVCEKR